MLSLQIPRGLQNLAFKEFGIILIILKELLYSIKCLFAVTFSKECARPVLREKYIACALYVVKGVECLADIFNCQLFAQRMTQIAQCLYSPWLYKTVLSL